MFKSEKGFTAIEMAIVLGVSSMIMAGGLAASKPILEKSHHKKTERKIEKINDQLASYVHRNNRLPCPADPAGASEPFGAERGSGSAGLNVGTCDSTNANGIVPFRTLGLQESDARDAWGNLISYHVSPVFALNADDIPDTDHDTIHEMCRSSDWVDSPNGEKWDVELAFDRNKFRDVENDTRSDRGLIEFDEITDLTFKDNVQPGQEPKMKITTLSGKPMSWFDHGDGNDESSPDAGLAVVNSHGKFWPQRWSASDLDWGVIEFTDPVTLFEMKVGEVMNNVERDADRGRESGIDIRIWTEDAYRDVPYDVDGNGTIEDGEVRQELDPDDYIYDEIGLNHDNLTDEGHAVFDYNTNDPDSPVYGKKIAKMMLYYESRSSNHCALRRGGTSTTWREIKASVSGNVSEPQNIHPAKARFCCPSAALTGYGPDTDLQIVDASGDSVITQSRDATGAKYNDKDTVVPTSVASDVIAPALALISHGPNGHGAFLGNGTSNRVTVSTTVGNGFGEHEAANADGNRTYVYRMPDRSDDTTHFDDIVMWRTQDQIYSEFGNQSCQTP